MTSEIDWKKADELMIAGCKGTEVAAYFGIHPNTFYRKVEEEKKISFGEYLQEKRSKGDSLLKAQQFAKAMGLTEKGDNTLLIWLGKTRLEQKEIKESEINNEDIQAIKSFAQQISNQKAVENVAETTQ